MALKITFRNNEFSKLLKISIHYKNVTFAKKQVKI